MGEEKLSIYEQGALRIRSMCAEDVIPLSDAFLEQGYERRGVLSNYLRDQRAGIRHALVATWQGQLAGYITLLLDVEGGAFFGKNIPEIRDFNVLRAFQRRGIGGNLMDIAEGIARKEHPCIGLAVGMHAGYGAAQRLYVKHGYVPDGTGLWYNDEPLGRNSPCKNDDDLVLYLVKELR